MRYFLLFFILIFNVTNTFAQANFGFSFSNNGQRVCLADVSVSLSPASATVHLLDAVQNTTTPTRIYRRHLYGTGADWVQVSPVLAAGTTSWTDTNVSYGDVWEYQVRRVNGGNVATGYGIAAIGYDQTNYRGRMILLVANNISSGLSDRYVELKKDLTGDGWLVQELNVPRASGWDSRDTVVTIRQQIQAIYNAAPAEDKPKALFILGHVPMPRSGLNGQAPDAHNQNAGARGADVYYADVNGSYTDTGTYNPGGLSSPYAVNLPGDFKWDQDTIASELEMGFGRIDFADITAYPQSELALTEQYLTRLHRYKQVNAGFDMGNRTGFYFGYDNSNDGSYRSLPAISGADSVFQNTSGLAHPQWVKTNGPFMMYMQNVQAPQTGEWDAYGMDAAIYSSDQSYWGFGDVPEGNQYSKIRSILGANSKCVMVIWTTTGVNIFHQLGAGEPIGLACRPIMDHNLTNQKLEKPSSPFDTPAWWNRTHFSLSGDPTIRLHQVKPASALQITAATGNSILLQWQPSPDDYIVGYHVYKSSAEFGKFTRISGAMPIFGTSFTDASPQNGEWYMVRAVKQQQTGAGIYFNPSQGIFIKNELTVLPIKLNDFTAIKINEQALLKWSTVTETASTGFEILRSNDGQNFAAIGFQPSAATGGNSNNLLNYSFTDHAPTRGNNFYRLRSVSQNRSEWSDVRQLFFDKKNDVSVFPNPVADKLFISAPGTQIENIEVYDINGRLLLAKQKPGAFINVGALAKGSYIVKLRSAEGFEWQQKIIRQ